MPTFDSRMLVIAKRDYLSRVRTPAFWITTVILPLLMGAWIVLPSLIMSKSRGGLRLTVVDETGKVASRLEKEIAGGGQADGGPQVDFTLRVEPPAADEAVQKKELDRRVLADEIDAWLWIDPQVFADNKVEYHGRTLSNVITLGRVERVLSRVVREQRLAAAGYDPEQIADLVEGVDLEKIRVTEEGGKADAGIGDLILAIGLFTILYMAIMIYGQMVMHGVLEEKANRVVEVIASTTTPTQLMAGKLVGICARGAHPDRHLARLGGGAHRAGGHRRSRHAVGLQHADAVPGGGGALHRPLPARLRLLRLVLRPHRSGVQQPAGSAAAGEHRRLLRRRAVDGLHAGAQRPRLDDGGDLLADPALHADDHDVAHRGEDAAGVAAGARLRAHDPRRHRHGVDLRAGLPRRHLDVRQEAVAEGNLALDEVRLARGAELS